MLKHLHLLRGLGILCVLRAEEDREVLQELGIKSGDTEAEVMAIRKQLRLKYMKGGPKARMLFDEFREIDMYTGGPIILFLCIAQAMVKRYQYLKNAYPDIGLPALDRYLIDNKGIFDAVQNLRDWVLHPGNSRREEHAVETLLQQKNGQITENPLTIVVGLDWLFQQLLEKIDEHSRRNS